MDAIAIAIAHSSSAETDAAKKRRARPSSSAKVLFGGQRATSSRSKAFHKGELAGYALGRHTGRIVFGSRAW